MPNLRQKARSEFWRLLRHQGGGWRLRCAIYARISTADKDQNVLTQLLPLREFAIAQGFEVVGEYVDQAPANDLLRRVEWRRLLDDAAKRKTDLLLVWRIDRFPDISSP